MVETYAGCKPDIQLSDIMARPETTYSTKWIDHLIEGYLPYGDKQVPILSRKRFIKDMLGSAMVRVGLWRMNYTFPPGLYLIGEPSEDLPVLVSCNYKLTLDSVRLALNGPGYWLLILDTKGVNVWCAAGKGTFGTEELIFQLTKWELKHQLKANSVILPQLGASRMTPHIIKRLTGIQAEYGPVRAADLDKYLENGRIADEADRTVTFNLRERLVLTPIEMLMSLKHIGGIYVLLFMINMALTAAGLTPGDENRLTTDFVTPFKQTLPWLMMLFTGAVLFPAALPLLPPKGFSLKGMLLALPIAAGIVYGHQWFEIGSDPLMLMGWFTGYLLYAGYLALNFTGSTTFTSFSGVAYEVGLFKKAAKAAGGIAIGLMGLSLLI